VTTCSCCSTRHMVNETADCKLSLRCSFVVCPCPRQRRARGTSALRIRGRVSLRVDNQDADARSAACHLGTPHSHAADLATDRGHACHSTASRAAAQLDSHMCLMAWLQSGTCSAKLRLQHKCNATGARTALAVSRAATKSTKSILFRVRRCICACVSTSPLYDLGLLCGSWWLTPYIGMNPADAHSATFT
jgi:hypothetical protein